jgi:hypothetical protein
MMKKIVGILVCMLLIFTALSATGSTNVQTSGYVNKNNDFKPYLITPANSPDIIAINFVIEVTDVDDQFNLLNGAIQVGDKIRGKYNYDTGTPDSNPSPQIGEYEHTSSTFGIKLEAGGLVFKTNPNDVEFSIAVYDNYPHGDSYGVLSKKNLQLSNGIQVRYIIMRLEDPTGFALSSDALPTTVPVISDWTNNNFTIDGFNPSDPGKYFLIEAKVIRASLSRNKTRDISYTMQPVLIWLLERFPLLEKLLSLFRVI